MLYAIIAEDKAGTLERLPALHTSSACRLCKPKPD